VDDEKRAALAASDGSAAATAAAGGGAAGGGSRKRASTVGGALLDMFGLGPGASKHSAAAAAGAEPAAGGAAAPGTDLFGGLAVSGNAAPAAAPAAASVSVKDAFDALCEIDASGGNDGRAGAGSTGGGTAPHGAPAARRPEEASSAVLPALSPTSEAAAALPPLLQPLAGVLTPDDLLVYIGTGGSAECLSQLHVTPLGAPREALYVALQTLRQLEARPHVREFSFPLLAEADPAAIAAAHAAAVQAASKVGGGAAGAGAGTIGAGAASASGAGAAAAAATWLASSVPGPAAGAATQAGQASWRVLQHLRLLHVPADLAAALARTEADVDAAAAAAAAAAGADTGSAGSLSGDGGPAAWRGQSLSTPLLLREDKHSVLSSTRARAASNYHTTGDAAKAGGASAGTSAAAGSSGAASGQPAAGGFAGFWGAKSSAAPTAGGKPSAQEDLLSGVADLFAPAAPQPAAQTAAAGAASGGGGGGGSSSAMFLGSPGLEGYADLAASGMYEDI